MKTPLFIVDEERIRKNCEVLASVKERTGCKILLALKGFALWPLFPMIGNFLDGVCASSPWEARLGREEFGGAVHAYAAAYSEVDFAELLTLCDEIDFNSFYQLARFRETAGPLFSAGAPGEGTQPAFGLRINPECSTQDHAIYDPCAPKSRLGITREQFDKYCRAGTAESLPAAAGRSATIPALQGISGLHFHTQCEQNVDALETTLKAVEEKFGDILPQMEGERCLGKGVSYLLTFSDSTHSNRERHGRHSLLFSFANTLRRTSRQGKQDGKRPAHCVI